ncbi:sigma-54-dependent transcriptional regulator [Candidatus Nitrospira salsa]
MKKKILIVDDDPDIVLMLTDRLEGQGYTTVPAADGKQAIDAIELETPHLVLLDLTLPRMSGLEVLHHLFPHGDQPHQSKDQVASETVTQPLDLPIIVMTANATIENAVEAMKTGAYDFLTKPIDFDHLEIVVKKAMEREVLKQQVTSLRTEVESRYNTIVGDSPSIQSIIELAQRAASCDATVLLLGESGTGKELFSRSIHKWSPRHAMPFSIINCVALNETLLENELFGHEKGAFTGADSRQKGRLEEADGGTLFLDEIGDMPLTLQAKLLRLLQDHEFHRVGGSRLVKVNIRVLAATNKDLKQAVKEGRFREDLYFRLNVVSLSLPPLRERPDDINPLAEFFLDFHLREMKRPPRVFTKETIKAMRSYSWPGNIRELSNAIARAVVLGVDEEIVPEQLGLGPWGVDPFQGGENLPYHEAIEQYSRHILEQALRRSNWSQTKAADLLQLQRTYLSRLLKQKDIQLEPTTNS